uniref:Ig-like domain-containing protein n=1 Tax=Sinocyclocheilus anshuiensis TaxID=1608454 RepID=A0A671LSI8_9TELE
MVFLFFSGFLQVMFSIAIIQAHPGQSVTMWCSHNIHVSGYLYWFKQTDGAVPITIVHMLYTESLQKVEPNYFNNFTKDRMVMDQLSKSTALTIKQVKMSDSGFYFCGATGYHMKFCNGTKLQVKGNLFCTSFIIFSRSYHMYSSLFHFVINSACWKNTTLQSSVSTEECSRGIYFKLTLLFGGIIFFTCIVPLILAIIREHRRQKHKKGKLFAHRKIKLNHKCGVNIKNGFEMMAF